MPTYNYIAKNSGGKVKRGAMAVKDEHALARTLRKEGYILTFIERKKEKRSLGLLNFFKEYL